MRSKKVTVYPGKLSGEVTIQPSKSFAHRALICASLAEGDSLVTNINRSDDIYATMGTLSAMGIAEFDGSVPGEIKVKGGLNKGPSGAADCGESGSTLRLIIPLGLLDGKEYSFTGKGRLLDRPMEPYKDICLKIGGLWEQGSGMIKVRGMLPAGRYELAGDISSQFISGLLFALSKVEGESEIYITTPLESKSYVDLTILTMEAFGVNAGWKGENALFVNGVQGYVPCTYNVEADYSHAAFFLVAGAISGGVRCFGLKPESMQGDRAITDILERAGADVMFGDGDIFVSSNGLTAFECDLSQCPDLAPVLAVLACACEGTSRLYNGKRLRYKESDRLHAMAVEIGNLGGSAEEGDDFLLIHGTGKLKGGKCSSHGDHRIAMAIAVASAICAEPVELDDMTVVAKSAPDFWNEFKSLGGSFDGGNMGK